jgi:phospholipase/carboxylesterase
MDPTGRFAVVSPRAPIERPEGGASWYDFDPVTWKANVESFTETRRLLGRFIEDLCAQHGLDVSRTVIGGFSQGAGMAAWCAFGDPFRPLAGLWCCGTVVDVGGQALDLSGAAGRTAIFLAGRQDQHVPVARSRDAADRFRSAGVDVTFSEHEGGHGISEPMLADVRAWLERRGSNGQ